MNENKVVKSQAGKSIEKFLNNFTSKSTRATYRCLILKYFDFHKITPEEYIKQSDRDFENDIMQYNQHISKNYPAITQKTFLNAVKKFLEHYDIELKNKVWTNIRNRRKGGEPVGIDKVLDNNDLKLVLHHATSPLQRAIGLVLSSSGMRIGELCSITNKDLDLETRTINLKSEYTKNGHSRYTFISEEAREAVQEWLKIRESYLKRAVARTTKCFRIERDQTDDRVFPFTTVIARNYWNNMLKKSGFDEKDEPTNRLVYHIHTLRKYFNTKLIASNMPDAVREKLLGHSGYLNGNYERFTPEQVKQYYDDNVQHLLVYSDANKVNAQLQPRLKSQDTQISILKVENEKLKQQLSELKADESEINRRVEERIQSIESNLENRIIRKLMKNFEGDIQSDKTFQELLHSMTEKDD